MMKNIAALFIALALCFIASGVGVYWTNLGLRSWYPALVKPSWNPPTWVFGPVWTSLYTMMAVAAWLVWRRHRTASISNPLTLFGVQLFLNILWPFCFFALRSPGLGFLEIVFLWGAIAATLFRFWKVNNAAGMLMVPYLLWVTYASVLNGVIWYHNGG